MYFLLQVLDKFVQKNAFFIKESVFEKHRNTLMCGLSEDQINSLGGVNINKYLAYLALCNSATDKWEDFDIDKAIVVEDMETLVNGVVDFIDDSDYSITRTKWMFLFPIPDGCGMILPERVQKEQNGEDCRGLKGYYLLCLLISLLNGLITIIPKKTVVWSQIFTVNSGIF